MADPKDVFLGSGYTPTPNDVRLGSIFTGVAVDAVVTAGTESYASGALAEVITIGSSITAGSEGFSRLTLLETFVAAIGSYSETYSALSLAERFAAAITAATEDYSAVVLAETFATAVQAVTETYVALAMAMVVNADAVVTAGTETGSDAVAGVQNPAGRAVTAAGGPTGTKHRKRYIYPEPAEVTAAAQKKGPPLFELPKPWTPESDQEAEDEMLSVFATLLSEDLF